MAFLQKSLPSSSPSTSPTFLPKKPNKETSRKVTIVEVNLVSAQDLLPAKSYNFQTYVVAYVDPKQKLTSRIDQVGNKNPTWNDKFLFAIDGDLEFTRPNLCLVFEIYQVERRRFRKDKRIGVVHVLLENLTRENQSSCREGVGCKFMAFNIRSPSGMPQGILSIGVVSLDGVFHESMPNFFGTSLAIDHRKLMGGVVRNDTIINLAVKGSWQCVVIKYAQGILGVVSLDGPSLFGTSLAINHRKLMGGELEIEIWSFDR